MIIYPFWIGSWLRAGLAGVKKAWSQQVSALRERHFINLNILVSLSLDEDFMDKKVKNGVI